MQEFRVCKSCGYERGFHVFFKENEDAVVIGLICPNCGQSYDPGWQIDSLSKESPRKDKIY